MLFISKNEEGVPAWLQVVMGAKTVTRRTKPLAVGSEFAVQSRRCGKAVARARVKSCELDHSGNDIKDIYAHEGAAPDYCHDEAKKEGFITWVGLWAWIIDRYHGLPKLYRIEYELIEYYDVCGFCGCTEEFPCENICSWTDLPNVCSECRNKIPDFHVCKAKAGESGDGVGRIRGANRGPAAKMQVRA